MKAELLGNFEAESEFVSLGRAVLFSPCLLFCFFWAVNILGHFLLSESLGLISNYALVLSLSFIASFVFGFFVFKGVWFRTFPPVIAKGSKRHSCWVGIVLIFSFVLLYSLFFSAVFSVKFENPQQYRNLVNQSYGEKNYLFFLLQGFTALFFLFAYRYMNSKSIFNSNLFFAFLVCLPFGGRNFLLFFVLFFLVKFFSERRKKSELVLVLFGVFSLICVTLIPVFLFGKIEDAHNGHVGVGALRSYSSYFFNPLHGFSWLIEQDRKFGSVAFMSDGIMKKLSAIFDFSYEPFLPMPYAPPPFVTNVYTVMWPIYHDVGVVGVLVLGCTIGCLHAFLSRKLFSRSGNFLYLYAASLYPLIMSGFHDTYFSSLGLWAWVFLPVVFSLRIRYSSKLLFS
jgi:oligosaccharide repeat unit polymerase